MTFSDIKSKALGFLAAVWDIAADPNKRNKALGLLAALFGTAMIVVLGSYIAGFFILAWTKADISAIKFGTYWSAVLYYRELGIDIPDHRIRLLSSGIAGYLIPTIGVIVAVVAYLTRDTVLLHGDAKFATMRQVVKSGLLKNHGKKPVILLGLFKGKFMTFAGQEFVILAADTRTGKGVGVVIPNCLNYIDSLVGLDVKGENFEITAGYRAKHGQEVFVFQPFSDQEEDNPDDQTTPILKSRSHRWNMLSYVSKNPLLRVSDLMDIAHILFKDQGNENDFFRGGARSLFVGLALYLFETPGSERTVGEVLRQGRGNGTGTPLKEYLKELIDSRRDSENPLSEDCVNFLADILSMPDNTMGSCVSEFKMGLQPWMNPIVDAATSGDDFWLTDVRKKRMSIFVVIAPPKLPVAATILNVFFSQLVAVNTKQLPQQNPQLKHQCLLLLDEFTAMGKIEILAKSVSYIAGYNLRLMPILQSYSQLESVYGKEDAKTFFKNHAVRIVFPPRDQEDAERLSKELGTYTKKSVSTGTSTPRSMIVAKSGSVSDSENVSDQSRALLLPQELKDLAIDPTGPALFFYEKVRPILGNKIKYYEDERFKSRLMSPPAIPLLDLTRGGRITADGKRVTAPGAGPIAVPTGTVGPLNLAAQRPSKSVIDSFQEVLRQKPEGTIEDFVRHGIGQLINVGALKVTAVPAAVTGQAPAAEGSPGAKPTGGEAKSASRKEQEPRGGVVAAAGEVVSPPADAGSFGLDVEPGQGGSMDAGSAAGEAAAEDVGEDFEALVQAPPDEEMFEVIGGEDMADYLSH